MYHGRMANFPDGPSAGAPLNFPNAPCTPLAAVFIDATGDVGRAPNIVAPGAQGVIAYALKATSDDLADVTFATKLVDGGPVSSNLVVDSAIVTGDDNIGITFNVAPDNDGGTWLVVAVSGCGAQAVIGTVTVDIP
jgi:hypothetical protein